MPLQLRVLQAVQVRLHKGGDLCDRFLHAVEIIVEISLSGLTQQKQDLIGFAVLGFSDKEHAEQGDDGQGKENHAQRQQCHSGSERSHYSVTSGC